MGHGCRHQFPLNLLRNSEIYVIFYANVTFQKYFIDVHAPMLNNRLDLLLNIAGNLLPLFQQILEREVSHRVLDNSATDLDHGLGQRTHPEMCEMRMIDMVVHAGINQNLDVVYR